MILGYRATCSLFLCRCLARAAFLYGGLLCDGRLNGGSLLKHGHGRRRRRRHFDIDGIYHGGEGSILLIATLCPDAKDEAEEDGGRDGHKPRGDAEMTAVTVPRTDGLLKVLFVA